MLFMALTISSARPAKLHPDENHTGFAKGVKVMGNSLKSAMFLIESRLADAARGDADAYFDLGIAYSSGMDGREVDLIQAHKWFNLAALAGSAEAHACRADISEEMSAREVVEAQRQARAWLHEMNRRAA